MIAIRLYNDQDHPCHIKGVTVSWHFHVHLGDNMYDGSKSCFHRLLVRLAHSFTIYLIRKIPRFGQRAGHSSRLG